MSKLRLVTALALCACMTAAFAQSLGEREIHASNDKSLAKEADDMNQRCKTTIAAKLDWSTFKDLVKDDNRPANYCSNVVRSIAYLCTNSADGLKSVQAKVKSVTCKQAPATQSTTHVPAMSFKNGEIVYSMNIENDYNITQAADKLLKDNL